MCRNIGILFRQSLSSSAASLEIEIIQPKGAAIGILQPVAVDKFTDCLRISLITLLNRPHVTEIRLVVSKPKDAPHKSYIINTDMRVSARAAN